MDTTVALYELPDEIDGSSDDSVAEERVFPSSDHLYVNAYMHYMVPAIYRYADRHHPIPFGVDANYPFGRNPFYYFDPLRKYGKVRNIGPMDTSIRKYYREGFLPSILSAALTVCGSRLPWPSFSMSPDLVIFLLAMPLPSCIAITSTPVYPQYFPTYFHEYLLETTNYRLPYVNMHSPPSNSDLFYMEHYYVTLWESLSMLFLLPKLSSGQRTELSFTRNRYTLPVSLSLALACYYIQLASILVYLQYDQTAILHLVAVSLFHSQFNTGQDRLDR